MKTVDTAELEALISRIIIDRPSFYHQIRELTPKDYQLIFEQGFRQAFTSTASLASMRSTLSTFCSLTTFLPCLPCLLLACLAFADCHG